MPLPSTIRVITEMTAMDIMTDEIIVIVTGTVNTTVSITESITQSTIDAMRDGMIADTTMVSARIATKDMVATTTVAAPSP